MRIGFGVMALVLSATLPTSIQQALAQDKPLVSGINGWVDVHGGWTRLAGKGLDGWHNTNIDQPAPPPPAPCDGGLCYIINDRPETKSGLAYGGDVRFAMPIGAYFGVQADAGIDRVSGISVSTGRAHLFMGRPELGTIGPAAQVTSVDKARAYRVGVEMQYWGDAFSVYGFAGHQNGNSSREYDVKSGNFICGEARWYVTPNAALGIGGGSGPSKDFGQANAELQLEGSLQPVSLFARGEIGETAYRRIIAGVRLHWGSGSTLIARHRQDIPIPYAACGSEQFDHKDIGLYYNNAG